MKFWKDKYTMYRHVMRIKSFLSAKRIYWYALYSSKVNAHKNISKNMCFCPKFTLAKTSNFSNFKKRNMQRTGGHPFSTYAKFPEYLTPPLPFVRNCTIFWLPPPLCVCMCTRIFYKRPPPPLPIMLNIFNLNFSNSHSHCLILFVSS